MSSSLKKSNWNTWTISICGFFVLAIAGCIGFVIFCSFNKSELVSADYYEQEMGYQEEMERLQRARALEHPPIIAYDPALRRIQVQMPPTFSALTDSGSVTLYRPSSASMDRKISLRTDAQGRQVIDAADLAAGPWRVKLLWTSESEQFLLQKSIIVAPRSDSSFPSAEVVSPGSPSTRS